MVAEAQRLSGYILRTFKSRDKSTMTILLKSLLISKLEYACVIWSPSAKHLINLIESVQRRFTSRISNFNTYNANLGMPTCTTDYWQRLKSLRILSLERRRERYIIIYLYKIIIGLCPNPGLDGIIWTERAGFTIHPKVNRKAQSWVQNLRQSSFFIKGPMIFNGLPIELRKITIPDNPNKNHVLAYKKILDEYLTHIPDQPQVQGLTRAADSNSIIHQRQYYI